MAAALLTAGEWYLYAGLGVAALFLTVGLGRIDANAHGAWLFRPLLIPGVLLVWPLVLWRWYRLARGEDGRARHRLPHRAQGLGALTLAIAVPVIIAAALVARQDGPQERPAVLLEAPA